MKKKYEENEKEIYRRLGSNVKFYRLNNNCPRDITDKYGRISQEALAELIDSSANMISNLEAESVKQSCSVVFIERIAKALNIPLYAFFLKVPIKNPPENPFE